MDNPAEGQDIDLETLNMFPCCDDCGIELTDRGRGERAKGRTDLCKECAFFGEQAAYWAAEMPAEFPLEGNAYREAMIDAGRGYLLP